MRRKWFSHKLPFVIRFRIPDRWNPSYSTIKILINTSILMSDLTYSSLIFGIFHSHTWVQLNSFSHNLFVFNLKLLLLVLNHYLTIFSNFLDTIDCYLWAWKIDYFQRIIIHLNIFLICAILRMSTRHNVWYVLIKFSLNRLYHIFECQMRSIIEISLTSKSLNHLSESLF